MRQRPTCRGERLQLFQGPETERMAEKTQTNGGIVQGHQCLLMLFSNCPVVQRSVENLFLNFSYSSQVKSVNRHFRIQLFQWGTCNNVRRGHSICKNFNLLPTQIPLGSHSHLSQKEFNYANVYPQRQWGLNILYGLPWIENLAKRFEGFLFLTLNHGE